MINIIKTGIITIIISFISGMLLDHYKNLAPRILCNIGKGIPIDINNNKFNAYIVTVKNISKKVIHEISLNIQSPKNKLKITDAKITKGLKFDSSINDDILHVDIPFLSKDDEFSVTVYVDNQYKNDKKPVVIIRSPEKFKEVNSSNKNSLFSIVTNKINKENSTNKDGRRRKNNIRINKKMIIAVSSIILLAIVGLVGKFYIDGNAGSKQTPTIKANSTPKSTKTKKKSDGINKNEDINSSNSDKNNNTDSKSSQTGKTSENIDSNKSSTEGTTNNTDKNTSNDTLNQNSDKNPSTGETTDNKGGGSSTDDKDTNTSKDEGTTNNTDKNKSTEGTKGDTGN